MDHPPVTEPVHQELGLLAEHSNLILQAHIPKAAQQLIECSAREFPELGFLARLQFPLVATLLANGVLLES